MSESVIAALATVIVGYLGFLGIRSQVRASREANGDTVTVAEQETAVEVYKNMTLTLMQPYVDEVARLRKTLNEERTERETKEKLDRLDRERKEREIQDQIARQSERIDLLTVEVKHWKSMAKAIARWATTLRDQVISLGGSVPTIPDELLMAQLLDENEHEK